MKGTIGGAAAGVVAMMAVLAIAEDRKAAPPGGGDSSAKEMTLEGEIVDLTSYLKDGSRGKDHWKVAKAHVKAGTPACILTFDGKLYVITPYNREGYQPLNNVGEVVRIRGTVYERDGVKCVVAKDTNKLPPDYDPKDEGGQNGGNKGGDKGMGAKPAGPGVGGDR
jgi:hypothetical protein